MPRAIAILKPDAADAHPVRDVLVLNYDQRRSPAGATTGLRGLSVELALPRGMTLAHDDRLLLDDGGVVEVLAQPEPLLEIRARDTTRLARAAWLLGDHHEPAQLSERWLRIRRSAAMVPLLEPLGVTVRAIEAPFEPEGGAYH